MWDPSAGEALPVDLGRHHCVVRAVAVTSDGQVVTCASDGQLRMWTLTPDAEPVALGQHCGATLAALEGGRVVSGGYDGRVLVWEPTTPDAEPVELGGHDGTVTAVAVLPKRQVISGGTDGRLRVWEPPEPETATPEPDPDQAEIGHHELGVNAVAVLLDGRVVSGGDDGHVRVWNPATPGSPQVVLGSHGDWVNAIQVLPDGQVVSGGTDGWVRLWDADKREDSGLVACTVQALAAGATQSGGNLLAIAHTSGGFSTWVHYSRPERPEAG